jgi:predicted metal-dependent phosphoesterase TrpH
MRWESPYFAVGEWLRGSLHTHTVVSDGHHTIEEVVQNYGGLCNSKRNLRMNYRFLAITDHTTDAKRELFEKPQSTDDFILIEGREDSYGHHVLGIGCPMTFREDLIGRGRAWYTMEENQRIIDRVVQDGGIAILAHPHWADENYWTKEDAVLLNHYTAIEIINGDVFSGPGHLATDVWDAALSAGKRAWATGNDDYHSVRDFHNAWNMVLAKEPTAQGVLDALRHGSLYVSNGACFDRLYADGAWIIAEGHPDSIYERTEKTFRFIGQGGVTRQVQMGKGNVAAYKAAGDETYIRVELSLNWGMAAFSQPFFWIAE